MYLWALLMFLQCHNALPFLQQKRCLITFRMMQSKLFHKINLFDQKASTKRRLKMPFHKGLVNLDVY